MNLHWIDWTIIVLLLGSLIGITTYAKRYMRSVADFLAANRLAGRYMLTGKKCQSRGKKCQAESRFMLHLMSFPPASESRRDENYGINSLIPHYCRIIF
jgi:hypothetical protein